jgi:hypothetical protein
MCFAILTAVLVKWYEIAQHTELTYIQWLGTLAAGTIAEKLFFLGLKPLPPTPLGF